MLRGTVYIINARMATSEHTPIARTIVELDVADEAAFRIECMRRAASRPALLQLEVGNVLEFGPISKGWGA